MGMRVCGFLASGDARHVAADAVGKRMNGVGHVFINHFMAHQTLLGAGPFGLELSRRYTQLMHLVTRCTGNAFLGMC